MPSAMYVILSQFDVVVLSYDFLSTCIVGIEEGNSQHQNFILTSINGMSTLHNPSNDV